MGEHDAAADVDARQTEAIAGLLREAVRLLQVFLQIFLHARGVVHRGENAAQPQSRIDTQCGLVATVTGCLSRAVIAVSR